MSRSPYSTGDPPLPCWDSYENFAFQTISPEVVSAAVPSVPKWTYTRSPSTMGVGEAWLFLRFEGLALLSRKTSTFTTSRPFSTSNARARSDAPPSFVAVVTQTRPPATTGDDHPRPGTGVLQVTFRDSLHSIGTPRSLECP